MLCAVRWSVQQDEELRTEPAAGRQWAGAMGNRIGFSLLLPAKLWGISVFLHHQMVVVLGCWSKFPALNDFR